jgi:hypothetical protein
VIPIEPFAVVAFFAFVAGLIYLMARIAQWIFAPLERRSRGLIPVRRFLVVDLLALMAMFQLPLALLAALAKLSEAPWGGRIVIGGAVFLLTGLVWWAGVELVSRAGVTDSRRRFVFLVVAVPLVFAGVPALVYGLPAFALMAFSSHPALALVALPLVALPYGCRRIVTWVAGEEAAPSGDSSDPTRARDAVGP